MRYIDADALLERLHNDLPYKDSVKRVLTQAPDADVVPRVELYVMRFAADSLKMHLKIARAEIEALEEDNAAQAETINNLLEIIKDFGIKAVKDYKVEGAKTITVKKFVYEGEDQNNEQIR